MEAIEEDGVTFNLPPLEPVDESLVQRNLVFSQTVQNIQGTMASAATKYHMLWRRFQRMFPDADETAQECAAVLDSLVSTEVYQFSNLRLRSTSGEHICLTSRAIDTLSAEEEAGLRQNLGYLVFDLTVKLGKVHPACTQQDETMPNVGVEIERDENGSFQGDLSLLLDVREYLASYQVPGKSLQTIHPSFGPPVVMTSMNDWFTSMSYSAQFEILAHTLKTNYVGEIDSKYDLLKSCQQCPIVDGRQVRRTVFEYYQNFGLHLFAISDEDDDAPFPFNILQVFFDNLDIDIKNQLRCDKYQMPRADSDNVDQVDKLVELRDEAARAEEKVVHLVSLFRRAQSTMHRMPTRPLKRKPEELSTYNPPTDDYDLCYSRFIQNYNDIVEEAFRHAHGETDPSSPPRCWGCRSFYPYDCHHLFMYCPHKSERRVMEAALPFMKRRCQALLNEKESKILAKIDAWQEQGFRSREAAAFMYRMNAATSVAERDQLQENFLLIAEDALFSPHDPVVF